MKTTFRFIIAAMAAIAVFSSCQKELANETANNATDGIRVISVQFDNSTKASLNGFKPSFTSNDKIKVSNSQKSEECTVTVSGTWATFTTTLSGALTAIYPAAAAVLSSNTDDAPIATSNNFKVLATQDGTMEKAIIASATVAEGGNIATFNGLTALFEITPPSGATSITITSLNKIDATTGRRSTTANAAVINTTGADDAAKREITVSVVGGKAYVSLVPGVNLTDLSFDAGETYGMKGIPASKITGGLVDETAANKKYTIGNSDNTWHPYVTIGGLKWATMNIGATSANEAGTYFAWGDVVGQTWIPQTGEVDAHWSGSGFSTAPTLDPADPAVLPLSYDAANSNWGGSWRMPTKAEFDALKNKNLSSFSSGYYFGDSESNQIFLFAAGYGNGTDHGSAGDYGKYWSSSLNPSYINRAYLLDFSPEDVDTGSTGPHLGLPVRALSE